jgi:hypothetical protein
MSQYKEDPRREFLVRALSMGLFATSMPAVYVKSAFALGDLSKKIPPGRSIYKLKGQVSVDGKQATLDTVISAGSLVKTGKSSRVIFVVGNDAFILRDNSELQLRGSGFLIEGMRMLTGKLLSVFGERVKPHQILTTTATIGIRGTGVYVESELERSYICTCYGNTEINSNVDQSARVEVETTHHDSPYYVYAKAEGKNKYIRPAPVINHTDAELELIEQLVGRHTPFKYDFFNIDGGSGSGGY